MKPKILFYNLHRNNADHPDYAASLVRECRTNPENKNPLTDKELELIASSDGDSNASESELPPSHS